MRPSEAKAALTADRSIGVLIDRRDYSVKRALPDDLRLVERIDLDRSEGVIAVIVKASDGGDLPSRNSGGDGSEAHVRLLDRFYLPAVRDSLLVAPLFDIAADLYDDLADQQLNRRMARLLLAEVLPDGVADATILDFGCGTGIGAIALGDLPSSARLVGVDLSDAMLRHAAERGMATLRLVDWRQAPPDIDGAIAAFVMHYGVPDADLGVMARSLKPEAAFAANLFGCDEAKVAETVGVMTSFDLVLEKHSPLQMASKPDHLLVFRKPA